MRAILHRPRRAGIMQHALPHPAILTHTCLLALHIHTSQGRAPSLLHILVGMLLASFGNSDSTFNSEFAPDRLPGVLLGVEAVVLLSGLHSDIHIDRQNHVEDS